MNLMVRRLRCLHRVRGRIERGGDAISSGFVARDAVAGGEVVLHRHYGDPARYRVLSGHRDEEGRARAPQVPRLAGRGRTRRCWTRA